MRLLGLSRGYAVLIAVSVALFLFDFFAGQRILMWGASSAAIWAGEWHRLIAPHFIHSGFPHLMFNMYALYIFGRLVEDLVGTGRFLFVYFVGGTVGFCFSLLGNPAALSVGASAAIFALMGYTLHYRLRRLPLRRLSIDLTFAQILGLNLLLGLMVPNIDQFAHLGGLIGGALAAGVVGMPDLRNRNIDVPAGERVIASLLLVLMLWAGISPLSFAEKARAVAPGVSHYMEARYGGYFTSYTASNVGVLWLDADAPDSEWQFIDGYLSRPIDGRVALAVFWRWARGGGSGQPVEWTVTWQRRESGQWRLHGQDRGWVDRVDPRSDMIYRRSMVVGSMQELVGAWRVQVEVDERIQFEEDFTITAID